MRPRDIRARTALATLSRFVMPEPAASSAGGDAITSPTSVRSAAASRIALLSERLCVFTACFYHGPMTPAQTERVTKPVEAVAGQRRDGVQNVPAALRASGLRGPPFLGSRWRVGIRPP